MNPTESKTRKRAVPSGEDQAPTDFLFRMPARQADPTLARMAEVEEERQFRKLILIASESACPDPVKEVLASSFNNLYAEGYPSWRMTVAENRDWADMVTHLAYFRRYSDLRYYRGCEYADFVEAMAQKRIKELFATENTPADEIFANVQPLSGAAANNAVYQALVPLRSKVVGMSLVEGGHLTHGSKANRSGKSYSIHSYGISPRTGRIDYDQMEALVKEHQPRMLIGGASAYPWRIDWQRMREIADLVEGGCFLMADIAHYAGLVVAGQYPNPIGIADVVTFTTHKSLCGPRGAVILTTDRKLGRRIDSAVFPGEQGGPHMGNIAAKAVAFHLAGTQTFRALMERVVKNSQALAAGLERRGVKVCYGGTESHLCLIDLSSIPSPTGICLTGEIAGRLLDLAGIVVNKNTVRGDTSAVHPSAVRLGTVWLSQLGYDERDMDRLAELISTLLTHIHPFHYLEAKGYVGRGKVDLDLLEQVRKGVDELIAERIGPPAGSISGYPHFDAYSGEADERLPEAQEAPEAIEAPPEKGALVLEEPVFGLLEVESERAHYFLQSAGTADVSRLAPGQLTRTFLLDRRGKLLDDVLVQAMPRRAEGWRRYLILTHQRNHARVRRWLRALSDGYVLFDDEDVFRKLEGPAMIEDLSVAEPHAGRAGDFELLSRCQGSPIREAPQELYAVTALFGPEAVQVLEGAAGCALDCEPGRSVERVIAGVPVGVLREDEQTLFLVMPKSSRHEVIAALCSHDAAAAGPGHHAGWRQSRQLPGLLESAAADELFSRRPDLFARAKVYYAGQSLVPAPEQTLAEYRDPPNDAPLRRTPLYEEHLRLGQKEFMVPFGGFQMPVRYGPIHAEHAAVRQTAGLFDVAHMGVLEVRGESAQRFLDAITTNYVAWLWDGQCHYSYLLDPDGRCKDDILVYRRRHDRILLVVNAANAEKDEAWIRAAATGEFFLDRERKWIQADGPVEIVNLRDPAMGGEQRVDLALQGPRSFDILAAAAKNPRMMSELSLKKRFEFVEGSIDGIEALISTTGYTGERLGYELLVHPDRLVELWKLLLEQGERFGIRPTGLGARDSTRIEAGFPLWGHELAGEHEITPIEAGYGGSVKFHKPFFVGRAAMRRHEETRAREVVRFQLGPEVQRLVRPGHPIVGADGRYIGAVTSNTQVVEGQIGLAIVDRKAARPGTPLFMYRLPQDARRLPEPKRMDLLETGDAVVLPDRATVIRRFLS